MPQKGSANAKNRQIFPYISAYLPFVRPDSRCKMKQTTLRGLVFFLGFATAVGFGSCQAPLPSDDKGDISSVLVPKNGNLFVDFPETPLDNVWKKDWKKTGEVVVHMLAEPPTLHPAKGASNDVANVILNHLHKTLVTLDFDKGGLQPVLIKQLPERKGNAYTYTLIDDARWDNGKAISSFDVVFSFKALFAPGLDNEEIQGAFSHIEDIEVVDAKTFVVKVRQPGLHDVSCFSDLFILQEAEFDSKKTLRSHSIGQLRSSKWPSTLQAWADDFASAEMGRSPAKLQGAGPYRVAEWEAGKRIKLQLKNSSSKLAPELEFVFVKDPLAIQQIIGNQGFDVSTSISAQDLLTIEADSSKHQNYRTAFLQSFNYTYLALNMRPEEAKRTDFFAEVEVRKAIAMATPIDQLIKQVGKGRNNPQYGPILSMKPEYDKSLKPVAFDVNGAKALLSTAGWKDSDGNGTLDKMLAGKKIDFAPTLLYPSTQVQWSEIARLLQQAYASIGIKLTLEPVEPSKFEELRSTHQFDMFLGSWGGYSLPEDYSQIWHSREWKSGGANFVGFGTPQSDSILELLGVTEPGAKCNELAAQFQQIVVAEQPYVFLYAGTKKILVHRRFQNPRLLFDRPYINFSTLTVKE